MERKPEATRKPTFGAGGDGRRRRADGLSLLGTPKSSTGPAIAPSLDDEVVPSTLSTPA
jgi:hypothetical protein